MRFEPKYDPEYAKRIIRSVLEYDAKTFATVKNDPEALAKHEKDMLGRYAGTFELSGHIDDCHMNRGRPESETRTDVAGRLFRKPLAGQPWPSASSYFSDDIFAMRAMAYTVLHELESGRDNAISKWMAQNDVNARRNDSKMKPLALKTSVGRLQATISKDESGIFPREWLEGKSAFGYGFVKNASTGLIRGHSMREMIVAVADSKAKDFGMRVSSAYPTGIDDRPKPVRDDLRNGAVDGLGRIMIAGMEPSPSEEDLLRPDPKANPFNYIRNSREYKSAPDRVKLCMRMASDATLDLDGRICDIAARDGVSAFSVYDKGENGRIAGRIKFSIKDDLTPHFEGYESCQTFSNNSPLKFGKLDRGPFGKWINDKISEAREIAKASIDNAGKDDGLMGDILDRMMANEEPATRSFEALDLPYDFRGYKGGTLKCFETFKNRLNQAYGMCAYPDAHGVYPELRPRFVLDIAEASDGIATLGGSLDPGKPLFGHTDTVRDIKSRIEAYMNDGIGGVGSTRAMCGSIDMALSYGLSRLKPEQLVRLNADIETKGYSMPDTPPDRYTIDGALYAIDFCKSTLRGGDFEKMSSMLDDNAKALWALSSDLDFDTDSLSEIIDDCMAASADMYDRYGREDVDVVPDMSSVEIDTSALREITEADSLRGMALRDKQEAWDGVKQSTGNSVDEVPEFHGEIIP